MHYAWRKLEMHTHFRLRNLKGRINVGDISLDDKMLSKLIRLGLQNSDSIQRCNGGRL